MSDEERLKALRAVVRKELRPRRARPSLTERDARRLVRREVAAGEGRTDLDDGELKRVDGLVRFGRGVGRGYRRPDWVGELATAELILERLLHGKRLRKDHQARCITIDPMHDERTPAIVPQMRREE